MFRSLVRNHRWNCWCNKWHRFFPNSWMKQDFARNLEFSMGNPRSKVLLNVLSDLGSFSKPHFRDLQSLEKRSSSHSVSTRSQGKIGERKTQSWHTTALKFNYVSIKMTFLHDVTVNHAISEVLMTRTAHP